jgi:hypothetical protein
MTKKIFPINTETSCLLKWNWSTIYFNSGTSASCHRTHKYYIDYKNFNQFHNLPEKIQAREVMLDGKWPGGGCEYCKSVESSGGTSDRQFNIKQLTNNLLVPPELYVDNTAISVTPTILEVYFTNTCNMACTYCGPHFSSLWAEENKKFNKELVFLPGQDTVPFSVQKSQDNPHYDSMVKDFWRWLEEDDRYKIIQRYHILGGEPFLLKELDHSIDFWAEHGNPDLVFSVITNLNIPQKRFDSYIKKFEKLVLSNKIWKLQLTASLDCWGAEQEYVRWGLDLDLWQRNFESLINRPWVDLSINSVISPLTVKKLPALIEKINEWNKLQTRVAGRWKSNPIIHSFNTSEEIYYFGPQEFKQEFEKVLDTMPTDTEIQRGQQQSMQGIVKKLHNSSFDAVGVNQLKKYLNELDYRRKTNWKDHFSWLDRDFNVQ